MRSEGSERTGYAFISGGICKEKRESRMPWNEVLVSFKFKILIKHPARAVSWSRIDAYAEVIHK